MKNKFYVSFVIFCGFLIFILLCFLISNIFNIVYGNKINDDKIIKLFNTHQVMFENVIKETNNIEEFYIRKKYDSYYEIHIENDIKEFIDIKNDTNDYSSYKNSIVIMEKLDISYISKNYNNISFTINSIFGLGQQIVYISNMEKYKYTNSISSIKNIKNNWYYVKTK